MKPLVSVIVAVYNVDKFLNQCIESIMNQTMRNIEIILIDDGSTDSSSAICDEYGKKDKRIKVIHQLNKGVSEARNHGMKIAAADFVMFVDGDDWLEKYAVEMLYNKIDIAEDIDVAVSGYYTNSRNGQKNVGSKLIDQWEYIYDLKLWRKEIIFYTLEEVAVKELKLMHCNLSSPWAKIYRKEVIESNNLFFKPGMKRAEDEIFNLYVNEVARKILVFNMPLYHYRLWDASTCKKIMNGSTELTVFNEWCDEVITFLNKFYAEKETKEIMGVFITHRIRGISKSCYARCMTKTWNYKKAVREIDSYAKNYGVKHMRILSNSYLRTKDKIIALLFKVKAYRMLFLYDVLKKRYKENL